MPLFLILVRFVIGLSVCIAIGATAWADESDRYALVIGNSQYGVLSTLKNPVNDATDMSVELERLGYHIHNDGPLLDLDQESFAEAILEFSKAVPNGAISIVYYAGHGVTLDGENYLLPVGSQITTPSQLKSKAISQRYAVAELQDNNPDGLNIFLVDACRDNPLQLSRGGLGNGLLSLGGAEGSFVGYAAGDGQVARDGEGRNGIYTGELLRSLRNESHLTIEEMHKQVKARVQKKTKGAQSPMYESNFIGTYCFGVCDLTISRTPPAPDSITSIPPPDTIKTSPDPKPASSAISSGKRSWLYIALGVLVVGTLASSTGDGDPPDEGTVNPTLTIPLP